jgi:AbrB family looped-hinge helix DNA binding protein
MSDEVTIGRRFSVVIPRKVRRKLSLKEGQHAIVSEEEGKIVIEPLPADPYQVLGEAIGNFSYDEKKHERKAEEWLKKVASGRH